MILDIRKGKSKTDIRHNYLILDNERKKLNGNSEIDILYGDNQKIKINITGGSSLWVESFLNERNEKINFSEIAGDLKYKDNEKIFYINQDEIIRLLNILNKNNFSEIHDARKAFLLVVFLVSEAVRNEVISEVVARYFNSSIKEENNSWNNYLSCLRNWNSLSKEIYNTENIRIFLNDLKIKNNPGIEKSRELENLIRLSQNLNLL